MPEAPTPTARELFTEEQIQAFLTLIREGIGRNLAAREIGATGRLMRSLARPQRDPQFADEYAEAEAEGKAFYEDRLRSESRIRALGGSDRLLEVELATHVEEYGHLRRDKMQVSGTVHAEHRLVISLDPARLDELPVERLREIEAALADLDGEIIDVEAQEIDAA